MGSPISSACIPGSATPKLNTTLRHAGPRWGGSAQAAATNGQDERGKANLARRVDGIHLALFEVGEIGPDLFRHACLMGLEGWSPNTVTARTAAAGLIAGSRSTTGSIQLSAGPLLRDACDITLVNGA